ncbi:uncharacterized protein LOC134336917 [Mobula hypostoma]|uniref:uncharacterized protein LOC134336917 n=1 Tax=Mobula hypostoma TaxID=723540 RepID=UPI002FC2E14C
MKQEVYGLAQQWIAVILFWVTPVAVPTSATVTAQCAGAVTLPCRAARVKSHTYTSVRWYKVVNQKDLKGIIWKRGNNIKLYRGVDQNVTMTAQDSLTIRHVKEEDSGTYQCSIFASLGGINQNGHVTLQVSVCLSSSVATSVAVTTPGTSSIASTLHAPPAFCLCVSSAIPPAAWITILAVLNVIKVLASYCSIQALRRMRRPEQEVSWRDVDKEEEMVQSLKEHIQRFSVMKQEHTLAAGAQTVNFYSGRRVRGVPPMAFSRAREGTTLF